MEGPTLLPKNDALAAVEHNINFLDDGVVTCFRQLTWALTLHPSFPHWHFLISKPPLDTSLKQMEHFDSIDLNSFSFSPRWGLVRQRVTKEWWFRALSSPVLAPCKLLFSICLWVEGRTEREFFKRLSSAEIFEACCFSVASFSNLVFCKASFWSFSWSCVSWWSFWILFSSPWCDAFSFNRFFW